MPARIVIAGGTGFLGRPLAHALAQEGHDVVLLTRTSASAPARSSLSSNSIRRVQWTPNGAVGAWGTEIEDARAVINLAGESIAAKRWTRAQKQRILDSRLHATRSIVGAIRQ